MTVNEAVRNLSAATGESLVVISGGDETIPFDVNTTPWQAVARVTSLPGVSIGFRKKSVKDAANSLHGEAPIQTPGAGEIIEFQRMPAGEVVSLCADQADLAAVLDSLSQISGFAFEVSGPSPGKFDLRARGTVADVVKEIAAKTQTVITVVE
jgi:hypothetical protein